MIKPNALNIGDEIAIIAPSSPIEQTKINEIKITIERLGFKPIFLESCYQTHGHFAGTDNQRLNDLHEAFKNPQYKGILCLKGGYGTPRLLNNIDYELIKANHKVFIGYSDITGLHIAFNNLNLITFHGPMASSTFNETYTINSLINAVTSSQPLGEILNPENEEMSTLMPGKCTGSIVGGNLSLLVSTLGSPYELDTKGKILFIEEVHEPVYKIDRMLTSLKLAHKFDDCVGVILGTFTGCQPEYKNHKKKDLDLVTVFQEIICPFNKPTVINFRAGHNFPQPTFPLGVLAVLDANKKRIIMTESATKESQ